MPKQCPGFFEKAFDNPGLSREVFRSDKFGILAILDIKPAAPGHMLVIARRCVPSVDLLDVETHSRLQAVSQHVGLRIMDVMGDWAEYAGTLSAGKQVPHAHIHRVPADAEDSQGWMRRFGGEPRLVLPDGQMDEIRAQLAFPEDYTRQIENELSQI